MRTLFLVLLFCPVLAYGAIALDNEGQSAFASAATVSWSHTLGVGSNSLLVAVCGNDAGTFSSIKFSGIPMTQRATNAGGTAAIWTLSNSTITGTANIVATNSAGLNVICASLSLFGVDVNVSTDAIANAAATSVDPSLAVTVVSSGAWIVDAMWNNGTSPRYLPTANANVITSLTNAGGPSTFISQFRGPVKAGSNTLAWTEQTSMAWSKAILSIKPSTGTPIVNTLNTTAIGQTTATGNGEMFNNGGFAITERGVCVGTQYNPTTANTCATSTGGSPFTASLSGLTAGTLYHARAYATNSIGTAYGPDIPFATASTTRINTTAGTGQIITTRGTGSIATQ